MARQQKVSAEPSKFEPGIVHGTDVRAAADEVLPAEILPEVPAKLPRAIILDEPMGWIENGVLCQFHGEQLVTNPADIKRLIQHGAQYMVVTPS